ncbi:zinc-ribbon domain-containing protein [Aestuariivita boseongensis]|uniref:zinc-ribbon domain-containing protein n=1 Tax=Aestuariivita boseongensis TaxID=1470562 RepID=UPI000680311B|nr:zinc-ribbon domain-containing protein [Aestuariivita boseongensis]
MRLTCPNCGAQYEVPDDVIPQDGRDVQCSNCGTTWFQPHPDAITEDDSSVEAADLRGTMEEPAEETDIEEEELPDQAPVAPRQDRRSLDPDVRDILQEEAAHEARLRSEETGGLETQPDLGLDDTTDDVERRAREARARMERLKGPETGGPSVEEAVTAATAAAEAAKSSRRDRLPDIDEINSSLRRSDAVGHPQEPAESLMEDAPRKSGFARGFAIPLLVVTALVLIYATAPRIADAVPALGPVLNSYVLLVDQLRVWLDAQISAFMP